MNTRLSEGALRLSANLNMLDCVKFKADEALRDAKPLSKKQQAEIRKTQKSAHWEWLKRTPEYMEWREFKSAIVDELGAVIQLSSTPLPSCEKLRIALRDGGAPFDEFVFEARVELERLANRTTKPAKTDHPYKIYYLQYISDNPGLRYPEAEAAKAYWQMVLCKNERSELVANESGDKAAARKAAALKAFVRRFKYALK